MLGCKEVLLKYMTILSGIRLGTWYMGLLARRVFLGGGPAGAAYVQCLCRGLTKEQGGLKGSIPMRAARTVEAWGCYVHAGSSGLRKRLFLEPGGAGMPRVRRGRVDQALKFGLEARGCDFFHLAF